MAPNHICKNQKHLSNRAIAHLEWVYNRRGAKFSITRSLCRNFRFWRQNKLGREKQSLKMTWVKSRNKRRREVSFPILRNTDTIVQKALSADFSLWQHFIPPDVALFFLCYREICLLQCLPRPESMMLISSSLDLTPSSLIPGPQVKIFRSVLVHGQWISQGVHIP